MKSGSFLLSLKYIYFSLPSPSCCYSCLQYRTIINDNENSVFPIRRLGLMHFPPQLPRYITPRRKAHCLSSIDIIHRSAHEIASLSRKSKRYTWQNGFGKKSKGYEKSNGWRIPAKLKQHIYHITHVLRVVPPWLRICYPESLEPPEQVARSPHHLH